MTSFVDNSQPVWPLLNITIVFQNGYNKIFFFSVYEIPFDANRRFHAKIHRFENDQETFL